MKIRKPKSPLKQLAGLFATLGQPARLRILLAIGEGEACVCHLEAALGYRQAYISQQLMALRSAHLVCSRREGRNIFYRLADPDLLQLILRAARQLGIPPNQLRFARSGEAVAGCCCPHCDTDSSIVASQSQLKETTGG